MSSNLVLRETHQSLPQSLKSGLTYKKFRSQRLCSIRSQHTHAYKITFNNWDSHSLTVDNMPFRRPSLVRTVSRSRSRSRSSHSRFVETVYATSRQPSSSCSDFDDSDTDCNWNDFCRAVNTPARQQRCRSPSLSRDRCVVQQNISQRMINIFPRVVGRRRSRPEFVFPGDCDDKWTQKQFDNNLEVFHRCSHGFGPSSYCSHCFHGEQGRGRPRHVNYSDGYHTIERDDGKRETYNIEKFMKSKIAAEEASRKKKQAEVDAAEAKKRADELELLRQMCGNAGFDDATPRRLQDKTDDDILRELAQCDADLKDCHERSLMDAQHRAERHRWEAFGSQEAYCSGALQLDGDDQAGWGARRRQPKPILKNTVEFRARVIDGDDEEDEYGMRRRRWRR